MPTFRAIHLERGPAGETIARLRDFEDTELPASPDDDVAVDIAYSTLNYKDALAITGKSPVVRRFPMVPGIDFAGTVSGSRHPQWRAGDEIVMNGWHAGETHWGGLAERARVPAGWLIRRPARLTLYDTMAVGTAGYTAALCLLALDRHGVRPGDGDVAVTGATGGVGSLAIMMLAAGGYRVAAVTGKPHERHYLHRLGAAEIIDRAALAQPGRPLQPERWAAAVDSLGSHTLANLCASTRANGIVAACGLAQGMDLPATVAPFILRGVTLAGINSVFVPPETRRAAWTKIEQLVDLEKLRSLTQEIGLGEVIATAPRLIAGEITGRIVVNVRR